MRRAVTLVAASTALSWVGVVASPHGSAYRRRAVPQIAGYDFTGCYTEATGMRALTGPAYFDDLMTVEKCASACASFKYFGVEYGRECYCGDIINDGSVEADLADCSFACPGDSSENCGAGNRLDLYTRTTDPERPTLTVYNSRGCYAEPSGGRALVSQATGAADMTVEKCAAFCGDAGYTLFGLEYYTECYCGNSLMPGAEAANASDCKYPCAGNPDELCGGDWRLNLYEFTLDSSTAPSSTSSSAVPSPTPSSSPATYTSEGCYTEAQGIRALSDLAYYDDVMTVEKCAAACAGYTWFGVEYGRECYGGNTIHSAEGSVPTSLSDCSFPCPGNPSEKCGAGDRLNVYRFLDSATPTSTSAVASVDTSTSTTVVEDESSTTSSADPTSTSSSASTTTTDAASETVSTTTAATSTDTSTTDSTVPETSTTSTSVSSTTAADSASTSSTTSSTSASTTVADLGTTSTTNSSAAAATTSSPPTSVVTNGDFEGTGGWSIKISAPGALTYSFVNTNNPHDGLRSASVSYSAGAAAYQAWFNQVVILKANTRYDFSGWTKASTANPGCSVSYYIGTADGTQVLKIVAQITSASLKPTWAQSTGFYDTGAATQYTLNVRLVCSGSASRTYYMDDIVLIEDVSV